MEQLKKPGRGGARPGAGRPKKKPEPCVVIDVQTEDARKFLTALMNEPSADLRLRADAAKALLTADVRTTAAKGKKQQKQEEAGNVANRFLAKQAPKLKAVGS